MLTQIYQSNEVLVPPSVIGEIISKLTGRKVSARKTNSLLIALGFQRATGDSYRPYSITRKGALWGKTIKGSGASDYLRWQPSVVKPILELAFDLKHPDTDDDIGF